MKIILRCHAGFAGATHKDEYTIPDEEWFAMNAEEQEKYLDVAAADFMNNHVECYAEVVPEDEA